MSRFPTYSKRDVLVTNYRTHTLHCKRRNFIKCGDCGESVPADDFDRHCEAEHAIRICDQCNIGVEARKLNDHRVKFTIILNPLFPFYIRCLSRRRFYARNCFSCANSAIAIFLRPNCPLTKSNAARANASAANAVDRCGSRTGRST